MLISDLIKDGIIIHNEFLEILKEKKDYDSLKNENKIETIYVFFFYLLSINNGFYYKKYMEK